MGVFVGSRVNIPTHTGTRRQGPGSPAPSEYYRPRSGCKKKVTSRRTQCVQAATAAVAVCIAHDIL